jgi:GNAT superfamily N-acetyltransferase
MIASDQREDHTKMIVTIQPREQHEVPPARRQGAFEDLREENIPMSTLPIQLRAFQPSDAEAFRRLNEAWIEKYFCLEQPDYEALGDPIGHILQPGGHILMACVEDRAVGCCALIPVRADVYEVAKMAVDEEYRGRGIGRKLLVYVIEQAQAIGATLLTLGSNDKLASAVHLYESLGFKHLPPEPSPYARANVFMELPLTRESTTS